MGQASDLLDLRVNGVKVDPDHPLPAQDVGAAAQLASILDALGLSNDAQGAPTDTIWGGTGAATVVSLLKYIAAELASTLSVALPTGASTSARQDSAKAVLDAILVALSSVAVTGPLTDTQLAARGLATQATLAEVLAKLSADPASQTTLAAILTRLAAMGTGTSADPDYAVAPPPTSGTVTIASGQSLSDAFQVDGKLTGIIMPPAWTSSAALTFVGSPDGATYSPIYDLSVERSIPVQVNAMVMLGLSDWLGVKYVKLRSGTAAAAVNQSADRTFKLLKVA